MQRLEASCAVRPVYYGSLGVKRLISYQLFGLLSLELKSHILETNSHSTPELLICALLVLTLSTLVYTARLLE